MKQYIQWLLLNLPFIIISPISTGYQAIVIVPVADLIGEPLSREGTITYETFPVCGSAPTVYATCPRIHQLLFNERVSVISEYKDQVQVQISNLFFITEDKTPHYTYWTKKAYLIPVKDLKSIKHGFPHEKSKNSITLCKPFYDPHTKKTYSAGTRFVKKTETASDDNLYTIYIFDPIKKKLITTDIKKEYCITPEKNDELKRKQFIHLLRSWIKPSGCIPYVLGGCSVMHILNNHSFRIQAIDEKNSYVRISNFEKVPKTGLDCSGLIIRATQICGIQFPYKNTVTLAAYLPKITTVNQIKQGDLLWIPGHVMIISDLKNNMLIEARGYSHGFGKVHEVPLHSVFKNIRTYHELMNAYQKKEPLVRVDKQGTVKDTYKIFQVFSLEK